MRKDRRGGFENWVRAGILEGASPVFWNRSDEDLEQYESPEWPNNTHQQQAASACQRQVDTGAVGYPVVLLRSSNHAAPWQKFFRKSRISCPRANCNREAAPHHEAPHFGSRCN